MFETLLWFALIVLLAFVAAVVLLVWRLFAGMLGGSGPKPHARPQRCPLCTAVLERPDECLVCGWSATAAERDSAVFDAPRAILRVLNFYRVRSWIKPEEFQELSAVAESLAARHDQQRATAAAFAGPDEVSVDAIDVEIVDEPWTDDDDEGAAVLEPAAAPPPPPLAPQERARRYEAARTAAVESSLGSPPTAAADAEAAGLLASTAHAPQRHAPARRRPFSELFLAFMEDKNIRWGELVGGLLIVCCSMALVISFWSKIAERPFLKFFVFNGVTVGLFGLGLYALHRWRLATTSRGLLIVAMLLVPLNFLALTAFTSTAPRIELVTIAGELASIAVFAALVYRAARDLVGAWAVALTVGVIVPSVLQLLIRRVVDHGAPDAVLLALAAAAAGCFVLSAGWGPWKVRRAAELGDDVAESLIVLLGVTAFAAAISLGLLAYRSARLIGDFHVIAPVVSVTGLPAIVTGLMLWRRTTNKLLGLRITGTSIALVGVLVCALGLAVAWPQPGAIVAVAALDFVLLTALAVAADLPAAHAVAVPCLIAGFVVTLHVLMGRIAWGSTDNAALARVLLGGATARALLPAIAMLGAGAAAWRRAGRRIDAVIYLAAGGCAGVVSFVMISWYGFARPGDPEQATWVYAVLAAMALAGAWVTDWPSLGVTAAVVLLAATVQGLVYRYAAQLGLDCPLATALVTHAAIATVAALTMAFARARSSRGRFQAADRRAYGARTGTRAGAGLLWAALATSLAAAGVLAYAVPGLEAAVAARHLTALAVVWLAIAFWTIEPAMYVAFQLAATGAALATAIAVLATRPWYQEAPVRWVHPWTLEVYGIVLGGSALVWQLLAGLGGRLAARTAASTPSESTAHGGPSMAERLSRLVARPWPSLDVLCAALAVCLLVGLACYAAVPGIAEELWPAARGKPPAGLLTVAWIPHAASYGAGAWALLVTVLMLTAASYVEHATRSTSPRAARAGRESVLLLAIVLVCAALLLATRAQAELATASALRWLLAGLAAVLAVPVTLALPGFRAKGQALRAELRIWTACALALIIVPIAVITVHTLQLVVAGIQPTGPAAVSVFARLGPPLSHAIPLCVAAAALVAIALRWRLANHALAAGLLCGLAGCAAHIFSQPAGPLGQNVLVQTARVGAVVMSAYALLWLAVGLVRRQRDRSVSDPLAAQIMVALGLLLVSLLPPLVHLVAKPATIAAVANALDAWTLAAAALTLASLAWAAWRKGGSWPATAIAIGALVAAELVVLYTLRWDTGNWLAYRVLIVASALSAACLAVGATAGKFRASGSALPVGSSSALLRWSVGIAYFVALLGVRAVFGPLGQAWQSGAVAAATLLVALAAWQTLSRALVYQAAGLLMLAATLAWRRPRLSSIAVGDLSELIWINVIALAAATVLSIAFERRRARALGGVERSTLPPLHRFSEFLLLAASMFVAGVALLSTREGFSLRTHPAVAWSGLASAALGIAACLWDPASRGVTARLYLAGLVAVGLALVELAGPSWPEHRMAWTAAQLLAAYSVATSYLWRKRANLQRAAARLGVPSTAEDPLVGLPWLAVANLVLAAVTVAVITVVELTFLDFRLRLSAAQAALAQALAVGMLAHGRHRSALQNVALSLSVVGAIAFGWAFLMPGAPGTELHRVVVVMVALAAMTVVYGLGLGKLFARPNDWTRAARELAPILVALVGLSSVGIVAAEAMLQTNLGVPNLSGSAIAAVGLSFVGLAAAALTAALVPGRDPLGLSERGRTAYVYAAEACLAGLLAHVRLTMPWLFSGLFRQFWPLIVVAVAFAGVGLGELFRRRRQAVLSEPLERTGILLPLLPVAGFWIVPAQVDYSVLLLAVAALYAATSILRKSFVLGVLAALAANGSLWYLLHRFESFSFFDHPQLWLIPPAVCVLVAAYLNRKQMSTAQMTAVRYASSIVIYGSSTADIFFTGVRAAPWLPLVLAGLSVLGVMAGIMLRVRAFLVLGTTFLVVALMSMIWYAAVDLEQTWVWAAAGIVMGIAIIAVFALFEKKRDDVLRMVEELKEWQP